MLPVQPAEALRGCPLLVLVVDVMSLCMQRLEQCSCVKMSVGRQFGVAPLHWFSVHVLDNQQSQLPTELQHPPGASLFNQWPCVRGMGRDFAVDVMVARPCGLDDDHGIVNTHLQDLCVRPPPRKIANQRGGAEPLGNLL